MAAKHQVYMPAQNGPFRCDHCEHYVAAGRCGEPHIVKLLGDAGGHVAKVDPGGCSDYFEPHSKIEVTTRG